MTPTPLLSVRGLGKAFPAARGLEAVKAIDDVSFDLLPGEALGIVGESGSGKTTMGRCIVRLYEPTAGAIRYREPNGGEVDLVHARGETLKSMRRQVRMIFQDPFGSLNPRMTVAQIIGEPLLVNHVARGRALDDRVAELMEQVGLDPAWRERYPHAFSGGQRQRIGVARAIALRPQVIVADEATSALDVSLRFQVLDLLLRLQDELKRIVRHEGITAILVTHDVDEAVYLGDRIVIMQPHPGRIASILDVSLPADRNRSDAAFLRLRDHVLAELGVDTGSTKTTALTDLSKLGPVWHARGAVA